MSNTSVEDDGVEETQMQEGLRLSGGQNVRRESDNQFVAGGSSVLEASIARKHLWITILSGVTRGLTLLAAGIAVLLVLNLLAQVAEQTGQLEQLARENRTNGERLIDCTTPEGQCYQDGQTRTGEAVNTINEVTILAASCVKIPGVDTEIEIRACIEQGLNK